ncbi:MAG TPA: hypothetical protein PLZ79_09595 [Burkholderiales bacterium]|nr:hypothetical protein [Betaproteobacteria bacterium]HQR53510.1 hypothetical protein [Burkholderiales bacterium]
MSNRTATPLWIAIIGGALLWTFAAVLSGRREPWDDSGYWGMAYPASIVLAGCIGYFFPDRPWRWVLVLFAAQFVTMCIRNGELGNLWPLGLALFLVLSLPAVFVATVAAGFGRRSRGDEAS